jgi:two-component system invasion response regulator UvrY
MANTITSFLIADDHHITRVGIITFIKEFLSPCEIQEAADASELLDKLGARAFDMLICDVSVSGTDGKDIIEAAFKIKPGLKILILTMKKEEMFAINYLKKGVMGYLEKTASGSDIVHAIKTILGDNIYMSPAIARTILSGKTNTQTNPFTKLSEREMQVCKLLSDGMSLTHVAESLGLGLSTVGTNKSRAFAKLSIKSLADLVRLSQLFPLVHE